MEKLRIETGSYSGTARERRPLLVISSRVCTLHRRKVSQFALGSVREHSLTLCPAPGYMLGKGVYFASFRACVRLLTVSARR